MSIDPHGLLPAALGSGQTRVGPVALDKIYMVVMIIPGL